MKGGRTFGQGGSKINQQPTKLNPYVYKLLNTTPYNEPDNQKKYKGRSANTVGKKLQMN